MPINHLKYKELYERFQLQPEPKTKWSYFVGRVIRYGFPKDEALQKGSLLSAGKLKRFGSIVKENGRVCTVCKQFKERDKFAKSRTGYNGYTCNCKECRNKMKADYRARTHYAKDHEYKRKKRNLSIGDQIYFQDDVREVLDYKSKKGYRVKSVLNGVEKIISTMDNHYQPNNHCVRFRKLGSILKVKTNEQIQREKELEEEKAVNLSLFD